MTRRGWFSFRARATVGQSPTGRDALLRLLATILIPTRGLPVDGHHDKRREQQRGSSSRLAARRGTWPSDLLRDGVRSHAPGSLRGGDHEAGVAPISAERMTSGASAA